MKSNLEIYLLVYTDDENNTFNVVGPIYDDERVTSKTRELQENGREVRICVTTGDAEDARVIHPENYLEHGPKGYKFDPNLKW